MKKRPLEMLEKALFFFFNSKVWLNNYTLFEVVLGTTITIMILSSFLINFKLNEIQNFLITILFFIILIIKEIIKIKVSFGKHS